MMSERDFVTIGRAAEILGVSEGTLRNWDKAGKLKPQRNPVNSYRLYRTAELHALLQEMNREPLSSEDVEAGVLRLEQLPLGLADEPHPPQAYPPCHWSREVALDPKHRPQQWNAPSGTVRRDWRKFPQEAHVLDRAGRLYRRFTPEEIALLQGFDPQVVGDDDGLTDRRRIAALGDAVPPPLARALVGGLVSTIPLQKTTAVEICAGAGGLAEGAAAAGLEHLALIDSSEDCAKLLSAGRPWSSTVVQVGDVRQIDFGQWKGSVGLLSGGPPCQPWSAAGQHRGADDERDLLSSMPSVVAAVEPDAFLFENVPGLLSDQNRPYLETVVRLLAEPSPGLHYGTLVGVFNAADFGVPQIRRRVFIVGVRGEPASLVHRMFDAVEASATHRDPSKTSNGRTPWRTVGSALEDRNDPGGWRRWLEW